MLTTTWLALVGCTDVAGPSGGQLGARAVPSPTGWGVDASWLGAAGDVDGDGFADLVVQTPGTDTEVYRGGAQGLEGSPTTTLTSTFSTRDYVVATVGDVDGDGTDDLALGERAFSHPTAGEGRVQVYLGGPNGTATTAAWSVESGVAGAGLGASVTGADLDGDGWSDVIAGMPTWAPPAGAWRGAVLGFRGGPGGPAVAPSWTIPGSGTLLAFGSRVAPLGDIDGDGFVDLGVAGGDAVGEVRIFRGGPGGPSTTPDWTLVGDVDAFVFGQALTGVGDLDGDGFDDFVVGMGSTTGGPGRAWVYGGSATGPQLLVERTGEVDGVFGSESFSTALAGGGDLNGDGAPDLVIGSPGYSPEGGARGALFAEYGTPSGITEAWWYPAPYGTSSVGQAVAMLDADQDGLAEVYSTGVFAGVTIAGALDRDLDGDPDLTDCAPDDGTVFHGQQEEHYDGVDADCDPDNDFDADGDGQDADAFGGDDCRDDDALAVGCLTVAGTCSTGASLAARGLTPNGPVELIVGLPGNELRTYACGQVAVDLRRDRLVHTFTADANGDVASSAVSVPFPCDRLAIQLVDTTTCRKTPRAP